MDRVEKMRRAREGVHTFFLLYLNIRSRVGPAVLIGVFEGREDIAIYDIWIARELGNEIMEPMDANGKANVLALAALIEANPEAQSDKVIFCADHDFDGTQGRVKQKNMFLTETYSIENLLVSEQAFDRLLIRSLNATGDEQCRRNELVGLFLSRLAEFNVAMLLLNAHIRFARLERVHCPGLPDNVDQFLEVSLDKVNPKVDLNDSNACVALLKLCASPLKPILDQHVSFLRESDLTSTGRGKFLVDFVRRFVSLVYADRRAATPKYFNTSNKSLPDPCQNFLVTLANAAPTAASFQRFIQSQTGRWLADGLRAPALA